MSYRVMLKPLASGRPVCLIVIDAINVAWITYVVALTFCNRASAGHNYLAEPILLTLLTLSTLMHLIRWRGLSKQRLDRTCLTGHEVYVELRRARDEFLGPIKYLPRLAPTDETLEGRSSQLAGEGSTEISSKGDALRLALRTPRFQPVCLFICFACGFYLWHGELPSFALSLSAFWPALALTLVAAAGMLVQSAVVIFFIVLFD